MISVFQRPSVVKIVMSVAVVIDAFVNKAILPLARVGDMDMHKEEKQSCVSYCRRNLFPQIYYTYGHE